MKLFKNKKSSISKDLIWKEAQLSENKSWQTRCSEAFWVFYEMGEHMDLPWRLKNTLEKIPHSFLDVGVGPMGVGLLWMHPKSPIKIGFDPLPKLKVSTGNPYADELVEKICKDCWYIRGRAEELPFKPDWFELVVSHNVLDHVSEPIRVLSEICRVVQKGGYIGISVDTNSRLNGFLRKIDRALHPKLNTYVQHPHDIIIGEIEDFLKSKGFEILSVNSASFLGGLIGRRRMQSWVAKKIANTQSIR